MTRLGVLLLASVFPMAALAQSSARPYSGDQAPYRTYDASGAWTIGKLAGFAQISHLSKKQRQHVPRHIVLIYNRDATFWAPKVMQWPLFPTTILGQTTYDTTSREFWMAFRTSPGQLHFPRYVTAVNIEIGYLVLTNDHRAWLDYEGVWYDASRSS